MRNTILAMLCAAALLPTNAATPNRTATEAYVTNAVGAATATLNAEVAAATNSLKTVAHSGSYNDLSNKPTIPTVPTAQINAATTTNALQDAAIAGKADKADATLTARTGFSEWVFPGFPEIDEDSERNLVPYENSEGIGLEYWFRDKDWETGEWGDWYIISWSDNYAPLDATSFTWLVPMGGEEPNEYTGTRTAQSGYQLGSDTNHILAAQSDLAAVATAATNYTDSATNSLSASLSSQLSRVSQSATNYTNSATNKLKTVAHSGNYADLSNLPQINGVTLSGNKTAANLGLATPSQIPDVSGKANTSYVAAVATSATNYTDSATNALGVAVAGKINRSGGDTMTGTLTVKSSGISIQSTVIANTGVTTPKLTVGNSSQSAELISGGVRVKSEAGSLEGETFTYPIGSGGGTFALAANIPQQPADIGATSPEAVTNIVRALSLGGIWDAELEVWWTPRMRRGSLTYEATTNVNLNAEN